VGVSRGPTLDKKKRTGFGVRSRGEGRRRKGVASGRDGRRWGLEGKSKRTGKSTGGKVVLNEDWTAEGKKSFQKGEELFSEVEKRETRDTRNNWYCNPSKERNEGLGFKRESDGKKKKRHSNHSQIKTGEKAGKGCAHEDLSASVKLRPERKRVSDYGGRRKERQEGDERLGGGGWISHKKKNGGVKQIPQISRESLDGLAPSLTS